MTGENMNTSDPQRAGPGRAGLRSGIVSVVQTPFRADCGGSTDGNLHEDDLVRLVEHAIASGVDGLLAPVVASEVDTLSASERNRIVELVAATCRNKVPFVVGASSPNVQECIAHGNVAEHAGASAYLVAVPAPLYDDTDRVIPFFSEIANQVDLPLVIQDLQFNGPGLDIDTIAELIEQIPHLAGLKIETEPAGPKYTAVRKALQDRGREDFWIAGGWAVPQMIEALDRGVDAMIPESAMIPVYHAVDTLYRGGRRDEALRLFHRLLPVLSFTNQELLTSIAFFKRLLVRKGIISSENMRKSGFKWDSYNTRIADELIEHYLELEAEVSR
jgi:dihydrodipicolinate synthase/N-acetylneuraminate lyase